MNKQRTIYFLKKKHTTLCKGFKVVNKFSDTPPIQRSSPLGCGWTFMVEIASLKRPGRKSHAASTSFSVGHLPLKPSHHAVRKPGVPDAAPGPPPQLSSQLKASINLLASSVIKPY